MGCVVNHLQASLRLASPDIVCLNFQVQLSHMFLGTQRDKNIRGELRKASEKPLLSSVGGGGVLFFFVEDAVAQVVQDVAAGPRVHTWVGGLPLPPAPPQFPNARRAAPPKQDILPHLRPQANGRVPVAVPFCGGFTEAPVLDAFLRRHLPALPADVQSVDVYALDRQHSAGRPGATRWVQLIPGTARLTAATGASEMTIKFQKSSLK